mgnify:CR=1 FL=1
MPEVDIAKKEEPILQDKRERREIAYDGKDRFWRDVEYGSFHLIL